jgi:hypothetical protein
MQVDQWSSAKGIAMESSQAPSPKQAKSGAPDLLFSRTQWLKWYQQAGYNALSDDMIRCLDYYFKHPLTSLTAAHLAELNDFIEHFLFFFTREEFVPPKQHIQKYIGYHPLIANLVAISDFQTTTPWVRRLLQRKENYFKLLVLCNSRTDIDINPALFFDINPFFASEWWTYFWLSPPAFCLKQTHERIRNHIKNIDHRLSIIGSGTHVSYFPITYVAPDLEHILKMHLNRLFGGAFSNVVIRNRQQPKKIALVTDRWHRSAVYTSLSPLIRSLNGHYDITLIYFNHDEKTFLDRDMFSRAISIKMKNCAMDLSILQDNEFGAVIYPDIGMNAESIYLSNIRIAPVQIMMYGHPASTWGSKIDYFIGGKAVEDLSHASENYGERLVVIPGMGVYPVLPEIDIPLPIDDPVGDRFIINCGWTGQKVSFPLLETLQEILRKAEKQLLFNVFGGGTIAHHNGIIPFIKDLQTMLGPENVRIFTELPQKNYLEALYKGNISLDAYPFGGFNTVIDALTCKKPVVTWETGRAYSRFGPATLRLAGLPELIAHNRDEYIAIALRLINDDGFRNEMTHRVASIDLKGIFTARENPEYFRKAVDFLIENHERLKNDGSREPIIIQ